MKFDTILVLGYGRIAEVLYIPCLLKKNYNVIICEKNNSRCNLLNSNLDNLKMSKTIPVAESENCVAINLTPVYKHEITNKELLEKGWNVFTEKLAAESLCAWNELLFYAENNNLVIVSAPVSANIKQENKIIDDINNNKFGEITEVHAKFIGGGPARRGFITNQRKWMLSQKDSIRTDLSPYLLTPLVKVFGKIEKIVWKSNKCFQKVPVEDEDRMMISNCGTSEVGVGFINKAILTILVSYRTYVSDVKTRIEIVGTKGKEIYNLAEEVDNGIHAYNRVDAALDLLYECMNDKKKYNQHKNLVCNVIDCIKN